MDLNSYLGESRYDKILELLDRLLQKSFIGTDTGVPYRSINHWESEGLIDNARGETRSWRRFSFVEFVWIRMIDEMRKAGLPLDTIKAVKRHLFYPISIVDLDLHLRSAYRARGMDTREGQEGRQAMEADMRARFDGGPEAQAVEGNWLQLLILSTVLKRCPVVLVVFTDGTPFAIHEEPGFFMKPEHADRLTFETHLRVPVTGLIKDFLRGELAIARLGDLQILEPNEQAVLRIIQSGQYESVTIQFRDRKLKAMQMRQSQDVTRRIIDVLAAGRYQDITIVQHEGQITRIENTLKYIFPA